MVECTNGEFLLDESGKHSYLSLFTICVAVFQHTDLMIS